MKILKQTRYLTLAMSKNIMKKEMTGAESYLDLIQIINNTIKNEIYILGYLFPKLTFIYLIFNIVDIFYDKNTQ